MKKDNKVKRKNVEDYAFGSIVKSLGSTVSALKKAKKKSKGSNGIQPNVQNLLSGLRGISPAAGMLGGISPAAGMLGGIFPAAGMLGGISPAAGMLNNLMQIAPIGVDYRGQAQNSNSAVRRNNVEDYGFGDWVKRQFQSGLKKTRKVVNKFGEIRALSPLHQIISNSPMPNNILGNIYKKVAPGILDRLTGENNDMDENQEINSNESPGINNLEQLSPFFKDLFDLELKSRDSSRVAANNAYNRLSGINSPDFNGYFKNGGTVMKSSIFNNRLPVGNEDKTHKSFINFPDLTPIQTEKGELAILPTLDIVNVNAKKRHSQMDENEVTDFMPVGSYILSKFGEVKIKKADAENIVIEEEVKPYNLKKGMGQPKVKTLADLMGKKTMSPADIGNKIRNKYKTTMDGDIFEMATSYDNKMSSTKYLQTLVGLSEFEKAKKGITADIPLFKSGGNVPRRTGVPKYPVPAIAGLIIGAVQQKKGEALAGAQAIADLIQRGRDRKTIRGVRDQNLNLVNDLLGTQTELNNAQTGIGLLGSLAQDPTVDFAQQDRLNLITRTPQAFTESLQNRYLANRPDLSGLNSADAGRLLEQSQARIFDNVSQFQIQMARDRIDRENRLREANNQIDFTNAKLRLGALNSERANRNLITQNLASQAQRGIGNQIGFETDNVANQVAIRNTYAANILGLPSPGQIFTNAASTNLAYQNAYNSSGNQAIDNANAFINSLEAANAGGGGGSQDFGQRVILPPTPKIPSLPPKEIVPSSRPCIRGLTC
jgi:hypothetical protein